MPTFDCAIEAELFDYSIEAELFSARTFGGNRSDTSDLREPRMPSALPSRSSRRTAWSAPILR